MQPEQVQTTASDRSLLLRMFNHLATEDYAHQLLDYHTSIHQARTSMADEAETFQDDAAFAFGRADPLVAKTAAGIYHRGNAGIVLFTGKIGKDSGPLLGTGKTEAEYLAETAHEQYGVPQEAILTETKATNGGQNAEYGLDVLIDKIGVPEFVTVVAHATAALRLYATFERELEKRDIELTALTLVPTLYNFDPFNPKDAIEATQEIINLVDYREKGYIVETNPPRELVQGAMELQARWAA